MSSASSDGSFRVGVLDAPECTCHGERGSRFFRQTIQKSGTGFDINLKLFCHFFEIFCSQV